MKKFLILLVIIGQSSFMSGQRVEYGLGIGAAVYWGDLNTPEFTTNLGMTNLAVQGMLKYNFNQTLSTRLNLLYGSLSGDDSNSTADWQLLRNLDFDSKLLELSVLADFHVLNLFMDKRRISPYLSAGVAGFYFNPTTIYEGDKVALQPLGTEGQGLPGFADRYSKVAFAIPFGGGLEVAIDKSTNLYLEIIARRSATDYIDDLSTTYVTFDELANGNGILAAQLGNRQGEFLGQAEPVILETGAQRGSPSVNDYYITFMATVTFRLSGSRFGGNGVKCPTF